jgi:hypothetical protein
MVLQRLPDIPNFPTDTIGIKGDPKVDRIKIQRRLRNFTGLQPSDYKFEPDDLDSAFELLRFFEDQGDLRMAEETGRTAIYKYRDFIAKFPIRPETKTIKAELLGLALSYICCFTKGTWKDALKNATKIREIHLINPASYNQPHSLDDLVRKKPNSLALN